MTMREHGCTSRDRRVPLFVVNEERESGGEALVVELSAIPEYVERFGDAFPEDPRVTLDNVAAAIAAYERTFISNRSTYDGYAEGRYEIGRASCRERVCLLV